MAKTSYNYMNQSGAAPVDDMEVVNALKLDPELAYTPGINKAALDVAMMQAKQGYIERGESEDTANALVEEHRQDVLKQIKAAEKVSGKKLL